MFLKNFVQGRYFKVPTHPALVHFPLGLFILSFIFDLANLVTGTNAWLLPAAFYTMVGGVVTGLLAGSVGFIDWLDIRSDHPGKPTATRHMLLNLVAIGLFTASAFLRYIRLDQSVLSAAPFVLSLVGVGTIGVSGYLGGRLVYYDGIGVGRYRRKTATPRDTTDAAGASRMDRYVHVIGVENIGDGETVRARVDGEVLTIVKLDGNYYAFNEFCTHRFGPLSEGDFRDGQVMCPWHRSCFDVPTGRVVQGPAKIDLKTYEIDVKDGQIYVRVQ